MTSTTSDAAARLAWRVIRDGPRAGAANMALDHALAAELGDDEAVLRLYSWTRPTVSFGRNEPARVRYARRAGAEGRDAAERRIDWVRRPTGGRAVLHDAEVTYAVIAPARALGGVRTAYRRINDALAAALRALGAPVALSERADSLPLDAGPCFRSPAEGEVTASGRKLVGSAQARVEGALLQHGSILLAGDQSLLAEPGEEGGTQHEAPATLTELVGSVGFDDVAEAVADAMRATFDGRWSTDEYRAPELALARRLEAERYVRDEWTWRR